MEVSVRARGENWMSAAGGVGPGGWRSRPEGPTLPADQIEVPIGSAGWGGVARLHPEPNGDPMTEDRLFLADLLAKAGDGDFLCSVAEDVVVAACAG